MTPTRYRKKPVEIEAVQLTADTFAAVAKWCDGWKGWEEGELRVPTEEGIMSALPGDFVIRGVEGEFYPCKSSVFEKTYERV